MEQLTKEALGILVQQVAYGDSKKVTFFISPKFVAKATFQGKRNKRNKQQTILVTLGKPNYAEREEIKKAKKNGHEYPFVITKNDSKE